MAKTKCKFIELFNDIKIKGVKKMELEIGRNETFAGIETGSIKIEDMLNSGTTIKFEIHCGSEFANDFMDFIKSKLKSK